MSRLYPKPRKNLKSRLEFPQKSARGLVYFVSSGRFRLLEVDSCVLVNRHHHHIYRRFPIFPICDCVLRAINDSFRIGEPNPTFSLRQSDFRVPFCLANNRDSQTIRFKIDRRRQMSKPDKTDEWGIVKVCSGRHWKAKKLVPGISTESLLSSIC